MQDIESTTTPIEYRGEKNEPEIAELAFQLFRARGSFFSADASITLSLPMLTEYFSNTQDQIDEEQINAALTANEHIFQREEVDDEIRFTTNRNGVAPATDAADERDAHGLDVRFMTPEPARERELTRRANQIESKLDEESDSSGRGVEYPADSWQAAVAAALRDAEKGESTSDVEFGEAEEQISDSEMTGQAEAEDLVLDDSIDDVQDDSAQAETIEAPAEAEVAEPEVEPESEVLEIAEASDAELGRAIEAALNASSDIARWGDTWMAAASVPSLSRGDIRKLQEYLAESSEAMLDSDLVQDLRGILPNAAEFETERFGLNYQMSREEREFEFVGTAQAGLWAEAGLPPIGTDRRKASEIGQDYRFLLDYRVPDDDLEPGILEHVLTFYEFQYGVLPFDANFATLLPGAAFNDQRATRLTFESPQTMESYDVELRYPTGNRGGYIIGLEHFFAENLVPGAVLTIENTEESETHFVIEYFQMSRQDRRLLQLDERKGKYVFKQTTYYCATQDDLLLDANHFEGLADVESLSEGIRRRPEQVVARTFERIGEKGGTGSETEYRAYSIDILAAANIERPITAQLLRDIVTGDEYPEFAQDDADEEIYIFVSSSD